MTDAVPMGSKRGPAVSFVFVAVMLDMITLGITAPVLPGLIRQLVNGDAALAARYVGWFAAIWAVMQFFISPIVGVAGPIMFTETFARTISRWSIWAPLGTPFYLAAAFMVLALILAFAVRRSGEAAPQAG